MQEETESRGEGKPRSWECEKAIEQILKLIRELGLNPGWDLILFGDGSGHSSQKPGGWACFGAEQDQAGVVTLCDPVWGAVSQGSINWMESMAYWHFLRDHYYYRKGKDTCDTGKRIKVQVITDSEWTSHAMSGDYEISTNRDMLALYGCCHTWGYDLTWKHVPRNSIALMEWADLMAAMGREYMAAIDIPDSFKKK
jgi:hypothetical protein